MNKMICVAKVIDDTKLVLNIGKSDGIKIGDSFLIYTISDDEIIDPFSKKSLGKLELVKGKGRVVHVQENMCTIESSNKKEKTRVIKDGIPFAYTMFNQKTEEETVDITVPFEDPKIGDFAKEI